MAVPEDQEDAVMQEADHAAAHDQEMMKYLISIDAMIDEEHRQRHETIAIDQLDRAANMDHQHMIVKIAEWEKSEEALKIARDLTNIIPGDNRTKALTIYWPGQPFQTIFIRLSSNAAKRRFKQGKAPVFDMDEWPVSQAIWPGLRYNKHGVFASTLGWKKAYILNKPATFLSMLPGELRNMIYAEVFGDDINQRHVGVKGRHDLMDLPEPSLSIALSSLRLEILSFFTAKAAFLVVTYTNFLTNGYLTAAPKVFERGERWGTGKLVIRPESWIYKVNQDAIRFHNIVLRVQERDGAPVVHLIFSIRMLKNGRMPSVTCPRAPSQFTETTLKLQKMFAKNLVQEMKKANDNTGFSLGQMDQIARVFKDPEGRLTNRKRKERPE